MILILVSLFLIDQLQKMKYSELERKLKKEGCYEDGIMNGHPLWYSPKTDKYFKMGHHKSQEIAKGTLKSILKDAGIKL
jgi:predicted RNA binding protein YcfA (HicA-like mRNA interferase family)